MKRFLMGKQESLTKAAGILMLLAIFSRGLGVARYWLLAHFFGSGSEVAAFLVVDGFLAYIYEIFINGIIVVAFIPVFTRLWTQEKNTEAWELADAVLLVLLGIFGILGITLAILAPWVVGILAPGIVDEQTKILLINLMRIGLLAQVILVLGSFWAAVCQSFQRFLLPAFGLLLLNVFSVLFLWFLGGSWGIYSLAWGLVFGALVFALIVFPLARHLGFRPKIIFFHQRFKEIWQLCWPRALAVFLSQGVERVNIFLASFISAKAIVAYSFAGVLANAPVGLFGLSMATASLPELSRLFSKGENQRFSEILIKIGLRLLFIVGPISVLLAVLRIPIVRLAFGAKQFDWEATVLTGRVLLAFALGVFAQTINAVFSRAFYAMGDAKTPLKINLLITVVSLGLAGCFLLIGKMPIWTLALAVSLGQVLGSMAYVWALNKRVNNLKSEVFLEGGKIIFACLLMGVAIYLPLKLLDQLVFDTTKVIPLMMLTGITATIGLTVYFLAGWFLEIKEVRVLKEGTKTFLAAPLGNQGLFGQA